jgi:hypothetical protein
MLASTKAVWVWEDVAKAVTGAYSVGMIALARAGRAGKWQSKSKYVSGAESESVRAESMSFFWRKLESMKEHETWSTPWRVPACQMTGCPASRARRQNKARFFSQNIHFLREFCHYSHTILQQHRIGTSLPNFVPAAAQQCI